MSNPSPNALHTPVRSQFADDPDFHELLHLFIESLNEQRADIRSVFENRQWDDLARIAHQLKGAGGGYGFPGLTEKAASLEVAACEENETEVGSILEELFAYIDRFHV